MKKHLKYLLESTPSLKFFSVLFGICFWLIWGGSQPTTITYSLPICFFGENKQRSSDPSIHFADAKHSGRADLLNLPETIEITLHGRRDDLYKIDFAQLAWHIDMDELTPGNHHLEPTAASLLLPSSVNVVHWSPAPLVISILETNASEKSEITV